MNQEKVKVESQAGPVERDRGRRIQWVCTEKQAEKCETHCYGRHRPVQTLPVPLQVPCMW